MVKTVVMDWQKLLFAGSILNLSHSVRLKAALFEQLICANDFLQQHEIRGFSLF